MGASEKSSVVTITPPPMEPEAGPWYNCADAENDAMWGIENTKRNNNRGMAASRGISSMVKLVNPVTSVNPAFTGSWLDHTGGNPGVMRYRNHNLDYCRSRIREVTGRVVSPDNNNRW